MENEESKKTNVVTRKKIKKDSNNIKNILIVVCIVFMGSIICVGLYHLMPNSREDNEERSDQKIYIETNNGIAQLSSEEPDVQIQLTSQEDEDNSVVEDYDNVNESEHDSVAEAITVAIDENDVINSLDYILSNSDSRYLSNEDLSGLSAEQCRLARNELYARHGRKFSDEALQAYFNSCSWYQGSIEPDDFDEAVFNDYEKYNRDLIVQYEHDMGYR